MLAHNLLAHSQPQAGPWAPWSRVKGLKMASAYSSLEALAVVCNRYDPEALRSSIVVKSIVMKEDPGVKN
jgi:hypothetical protein